MKIYLKSGARDHTIFATPATDTEHPDTKDCSDFVMSDGSPASFTVVFRDGRADVISALGKYLLSKDVVQSQPAPRSLILRPQDVLDEPRPRRHQVIAHPL